MNPEEKRWMDAQVRMAKVYGQTFTIYRPNYSVVDNTPTNIGTIRLKVEKTGPRLHKGEFARVEYYAIFGKYSRLELGDILICSTNNTPPITVSTMSRFEETMGFMTSRTCSIVQTTGGDPIYTNVRFEWVSDSGFPGSSFVEALAANLSVPTRKAVMYARPNLAPENFLGGDVQGMHLIEDGPVGITWTIKLVECIGTEVQLTLQRL